MKNLIVLSDGRELSSGRPGAAIQSVRMLQTVSSTQELEPGAVCAAMAEIRLLDGVDLTVTPGERLQLYKVDEEGNRTLTGTFLAEKPVRTAPGCYTVTAYDPVSLLDRDLTEWFQELDRWPYTLWELAHMICKKCVVALVEDPPPGGSILVGKCSVGQVTGRQLIRWIAQALGRFCRATPGGELEFGWYSPVMGLTLAPTQVTPMSVSLQADTLTVDADRVEARLTGNTLTLTGPALTATLQGNTLVVTQGGGDWVAYRRGSLQLSEVTVAPVERVQLRATAEDVGIVYPDTEGEKNTYILTGNPILQAVEVADRRELARNLYELLSQVTYTPCTLSIDARTDIRAGSVIPLQTDDGRVAQIYVMTREQTGNTDRLISTGSANRSSTTAVNSYARQLSGKVLELRMDVEGLRAENRQNREKAASLQLDVEGITARVEQQAAQSGALEQQLSLVEQTARELSVQMQSVRQEGVDKVTTTTGYRFGPEGLRISKTGEQMENLLDHTGMYVRRSGQVILQATGDGVTATDVAVRNYLLVGSHARLEDYATGRTACFYIN